MGSKARVVVIGAGMSGLTAARTLTNAGYDVTVLEGRPDRIGGRTWTHKLGNSQIPIDMGASYIHGSHRTHPIYELAHAHGFETTEADEDDIKIWSEEGAKYGGFRLLFSGLKLKWDQYKLLKKTSRDENNVSLRDAIVEQDRTHMLTEPVSLMWLDMLETVYGASIKDISAKGVLLQYEIASASKNTKELIICKGYSQIVDVLAKGHGSEKPLDIKLGTSVTKVTVAKDESEVTLTTHDNQTVTYSAAIVTVPLGVLKSGAIQFDPPLPEPKMEAVRNLGFNVLNKVILEFKEVFWPAKTTYVCVTPSCENNMGMLNIWLNGYMITGHPVLIGYVGGEDAKTLENMSEQELLSVALGKLNKIVGKEKNISEEDIVSHFRTRWSQEEFTRGAYSYFKVGNVGNEYELLGQPVGKCLFFAGEHTHFEQSATTTGAHLSGLRAAQEVKERWS